MLELAEGETLYSGLTASTDITVEHFYDRVIVPSQAVLDRRVEDLPKEIREGNEFVDIEKTFVRCVYKVVDGKTVITPVTVGPSDLTTTVITGGLDEGEFVVSGPYRVLVNIGHDQAVREEDDESDADDDADTDDVDAEGDAGTGAGTEEDDDAVNASEDDAQEAEESETAEASP